MNPLHYKLHVRKSSCFASVQQQVQEALSADYQVVEIDCSTIESIYYSSLVLMLRQYELSLCVNVYQNQASYISNNVETLTDISSVVFVFDEVLTASDQEFLTSLGSKLKALKCRIEDPSRFFCLAQSVLTAHYDILETEFSYLATPRNDDCVDIYNAINVVRHLLPKLPIRAPQYHDVPNPDVGHTRSIEPSHVPLAVNNKFLSKREISVVIPTFNNWHHLRKTLLQFTQQSLRSSAFELIVVDDGSNDDTIRKLEPLLDEIDLNSVFLRHDRKQARSRGTGDYSAGIARNYGVKHASAEIILFLDSDILIANSMLEDLIELHKQFDLIQGKRIELNQHDSKGGGFYEQIPSNKRTELEDSVFWGTFYDYNDNKRRWSDHPTPWQFVCSHSLSVKKKHFMQSGRFRKTFCYYGFEDTDLGYRLFEHGVTKFHLYEKPVYHCYQSNSLSEYGNSHWKKLAILRRSARVFYRNTLNEDVYQQCEPFFKVATPKAIIRHWLYTILHSLGQYRVFRQLVYTVFLAKAKMTKAYNISPVRRET